MGKGAPLALLIGTLFLAACGDSPSAPPFEPALVNAQVDHNGPGELNGTVANEGRSLIRWMRPVTSDVSASKYCPAKQRCSIELRDINVFMVIPRGALRDGTTISVTALAGEYVNFEFGPHGTQFAKPILVTVSASDTDVSGKADVVALYWGEDETGNPVILEELPAKVFRGRINFAPTHFSGYALAM